MDALFATLSSIEGMSVGEIIEKCREEYQVKIPLYSAHLMLDALDKRGWVVSEGGQCTLSESGLNEQRRFMDPS